VFCSQTHCILGQILKCESPRRKSDAMSPPNLVTSPKSSRESRISAALSLHVFRRLEPACSGQGCDHQERPRVSPGRFPLPEDVCFELCAATKPKAKTMEIKMIVVRRGMAFSPKLFCIFSYLCEARRPPASTVCAVFPKESSPSPGNL
jgi:hypothetical protein